MLRQGLEYLGFLLLGLAGGIYVGDPQTFTLDTTLLVFVLASILHLNYRVTKIESKR